jgi:hypothetical protein
MEEGQNLVASKARDVAKGLEQPLKGAKEAGAKYRANATSQSARLRRCKSAKRVPEGFKDRGKRNGDERYSCNGSDQGASPQASKAPRPAPTIADDP